VTVWSMAEVVSMFESFRGSVNAMTGAERQCTIISILMFHDAWFSTHKNQVNRQLSIPPSTKVASRIDTSKMPFSY
jgi:hypothetical protein